VFRSRGPKKSVKLGSLEDPRITLPRERSGQLCNNCFKRSS